jgi:hypothetical protein
MQKIFKNASGVNDTACTQLKSLLLYLREFEADFKKPLARESGGIV